MFTPGPSTMSTPRAIASRPSARPISRSRSGSQVAALQEAVGKQVAALAANAMDSGALGPADTVRSVRHAHRGQTKPAHRGVVHAESPVNSEAFSSSVIAASADAHLLVAVGTFSR